MEERIKWDTSIRDSWKRVKKNIRSVFPKKTKGSSHEQDKSKERVAIEKEAMRQYLGTKYREREDDHFSILPTRRFH